MTQADFRKAGSAGGPILVVDSDAQNLLFLSMVLQRLGYRSRTAPGAGHALEAVRDSAPSLIISELNLRGMSGLDLLRQVRRPHGDKALPVVIMTRDLTPEVERQYKEEGAAACLGKPIMANELYQAIHPLIEPGSRRNELRIQTTLSVSVNARPLDCVEGECATNLSTNGVYIRTRESYPVNSLVLMQVTLYGQAIEAEARIVYCRETEKGHSGMWGIGMHFLKTSPGARELILRFINEEVSHGIAPGFEA